jgi:hypothetical protein
MVYDQLQTSITNQYSMYLSALMGRYQAMRAAGVKPSPQVVARMRADCLEFRETFCRSASQEVARYATTLSEGASAPLVASLISRTTNMVEFIRSATLENVNQVVQAAVTGVAGFREVLKGARGAVGELVQRDIGNIDFKVSTESGAKWSAGTLMRFAVRDFAYQCRIDSTVEELLDQGVTVVEAYRDDAGTLATLSLDGSGPGGLQTLAEVRSTLFHPNSTTLIRPAHVLPT